MDPKKGDLKDRLVDGGHWPKGIAPDKDVNCQLHRWATGRKHRAKVMKCMQCNVNLCIGCFYIFHTKPDLTGDVKRELQLEDKTNEERVRETAKNVTAVYYFFKQSMEPN